ncbi:pilus assembly protein TadG-related protein [Pseudomonas sp. FP2309]|uniref:pilus assembly protein TadG-related protein n=1 Tax=Pseudomonas sp. FP2309 TaxID=2954091 RepID=UPI002734BCD3|nr:pilus assembly protein TadG-related protein [Pseudomonas sp. FP2309]WLH69131.1 pilus assembly protein TadG-related protein [Pseudomonas sp. FP2309]
MSPRFRSQQRGAIGLMAAGTLALALVFLLLAVDSGRLYLEKRKLQSIADTSALEAAARGGLCTPTTTANDYARQNAARNGFTLVAGDASRGLTVSCGTLATNAANIRVFTADASRNDAIRVVATQRVTSSVASGIWGMFSGNGPAVQTVMSATAVAAYAPPVAQLTIRSSLATVDSSKSPALNMIIGNLLGGSLSLTPAGWNGLLQSNVNLLGYLDQLAIDLTVKAGDYEALLNTNVSAAQLINAAAKVLQKNGAAAAVINDVLSLKAVAPNAPLLKVGDLLKVATGTPSAALNTNLQLFQLLEAVAQLSSSKSAVSTAVQLNIPLVGNVSIQTKVIQPPQLSAIGNPALAKAGLNNTPKTDQIFVRTAQVRTLVSIDLPVLKGVSQLTSAVTALTTPVTGVVNNLLHLNLVGTLDPLLCLVLKPCDHTDPQLFSRLDINLEAVSAESYVKDFSCASSAAKSLTVQTKTSLADLSIGKINATDAFSSSAAVSVQPVPLVDIGVQTCKGIFGCAARQPGVGGSLLVQFAHSTVGGTDATMLFAPVSEMNAAPTYQKALPSSDMVNSLVNTLGGIQVTYAPPSGNVSSGALAGVAGLLTTITTTLVGAIQNLLSPVLDPIVNTILGSLGITLGNAEVGANLTCHMGRAYLVI